MDIIFYNDLSLVYCICCLGYNKIILNGMWNKISEYKWIKPMIREENRREWIKTGFQSNVETYIYKRRKLSLPYG